MNRTDTFQLVRAAVRARHEAISWAGMTAVFVILSAVGVAMYDQHPLELLGLAIMAGLLAFTMAHTATEYDRYVDARDKARAALVDLGHR